MKFSIYLNRRVFIMRDANYGAPKHSKASNNTPGQPFGLYSRLCTQNRGDKTGNRNCGAPINPKASDDNQGQPFNLTQDFTLRLFTLYLTQTEYPKTPAGLLSNAIDFTPSCTTHAWWLFNVTALSPDCLRTQLIHFASKHPPPPNQLKLWRA